MVRRTTGRILILILFLSMMAAPGCHTYRVQAPGYPGVAFHEKVVWSYGWGTLHTPLDIENCNGQPLAEVTVRSNLLDDLISVLTLGFASPKSIEWKCARAPSPAGTMSNTTVPALPEERPEKPFDGAPADTWADN